jgi:hypothetical protein
MSCVAPTVPASPNALPSKAFRVALAAVAVTLGCWLGAPAWAQSLVLERTIELPDGHGRLDHLDIDLEGSRLFVAALGAGSLEVIDLVAARRVARIAPLGEPQGVAYLADSHRLVVASGGSGRLDAYDAVGSTAAASVLHLDDADNLRFDAVANQLFVGYGQALAVFDPKTLQIVRRWALAGHPEAFAIESSGRYVYVNVPSASHVAVVDRGSDRVTTTWPVTGASGNFAMALDAAAHRLFVATRRPALLLAYDTESGKRVAELALCSDADDLFFDSTRRQLYAICGEGKVDVIRQRDADHYELGERVSTVPGARTGLFVPGRSTLFVAAPARAGASAGIRIYRVE